MKPLYTEIFANQISIYQIDYEIFGAGLDFISSIFVNK